MDMVSQFSKNLTKQVAENLPSTEENRTKLEMILDVLQKGNED